jgi:hypothetical protein
MLKIADDFLRATVKARLERALSDAKRYGVSVAEIRQLLAKRPSTKPSRFSTKPAPAHGWDSYTYINTAVDLRMVRGFNLLLQSECERRAPYTRHAEWLVFPSYASSRTSV